jgi:hypothetical protein
MHQSGMQDKRLAAAERQDEAERARLEQIKQNQIRAYQGALERDPNAKWAAQALGELGVSPDGYTPAPDSAGGSDVSLTPIWGTDAEGNPVLIQPSRTGKAIQTELPEGVTPNYGVEKIDLGDSYVFQDKKSGAFATNPDGSIKVVPKNLEDAEAAKAKGKKRGEASFNLGRVVERADELLGLIDEVLEDPDLNALIGSIEGRMPTAMRKGKKRTLQRKIDQIIGKSWVEAYQSLKGGGHITEIEGQKAAEAKTRLQDQTIDEAGYIDALKDYRNIVAIGLQRAYEEAGEAPQANPSDPAGIL